MVKHLFCLHNTEVKVPHETNYTPAILLFFGMFEHHGHKQNFLEEERALLIDEICSFKSGLPFVKCIQTE